MHRLITSLFLVLVFLLPGTLQGKSQLPGKAASGIGNFAVANHHTYFAGKGGVWVHNDCRELREEVVARLVSLIVERDGLKGRVPNHSFDPDIYDQSQIEALAMLHDDVYTAGQRALTGATIFEKNPRVINADVEEDPDIIREFIDQTAYDRNYPLSIARFGDGFQPYFGAPGSQSPSCWNDLSDEVKIEILAPYHSRPKPIAVRFAEEAVYHCESKALIRSEKNEVHLTTANKEVCSQCINRSGSGIGEVMKAIDMKKVTLHADQGLEDGERYNNTKILILEIDENTGEVVEIIP